jgi:hypothetical protein
MTYSESPRSKRAERRAAMGHEGAMRSPWPAHASRRARLALQPSKPAQAGLEPRLSFPLGDQPTYSSDGGLQ